MPPSLNQNGRRVNTSIYRIGAVTLTSVVDRLPGMPARIGPKKPLRLYIAEWREHRKLTQAQLGARLGTSDVTISRYETGARKPDLNVQAAIAEALDIDPFDLRRHPDQPSADALLRDQPQDIRDQAIRLIQALRRPA